MELVVDKMMKKKVSIIPLTLSIVIAAAWTLRWAIDSRDVSLEEILAFKGVHIKSEEITAFHLATTIYGGIKSSITIKPGDLQLINILSCGQNSNSFIMTISINILMTASC